MRTARALLLVLTIAAGWPLQARIPPDLRTKITRYRDTPKGKALDLLLSGDTRTPLADRDDQITPFQMKSFRNGQSDDVQLIAQAPECHIDTVGERAWDKGPIVLFAPTSNVWVEGEGFLFTEADHSLDISNKVRTRILRSLLKTTILSGARTNAPATAEQFLNISSDRSHFDYQSNFARYFGRVHAVDAQLDLTSERLTIQLTSNSAIETILAEDNVVMTTTNKGWATGARAFYYVTNGSEMIELSGGAVWHNGDEKAKADAFLYDSTRHFLTGAGHVRVWWPNAPARPGAAPQAGAGGYRELWADYATLQWPPTNGPVETMHAAGNVLIVNQADRSSATGDQADYSRRNDSFELTGSPAWWNDKMEIRGRRLTAQDASKTYHARGDASLKLQVSGAVHTNQWLYIASRDLDYQTNLAVFTDHVKSRLLEDGVLRDTLCSDRLDVELAGNEARTAVARGHVQGETAPDKAGRIKTIACDTLTAHRSPKTLWMTDVVAESRVVLRQFGTNAADTRSQLTAAVATAYFSTVVSNQVERAVAVNNVVIDQVRTNQTIHATGERAVFTVADDEINLTGTPLARTDRYVISNSDRMVWHPKTNRFQAIGPYTIIPVKVLTNKPSS